LERLVDIPALAAAYLRRGDHRHEEAERELHWMLMEEPDDAWEFIQAAIDAAQTVDDLGYIGAGPIEDLLRYWGGRFNDDLIAGAQSDARWGYAARMLRDTPGAQEAADAAEAAWPNFQDLTVAAAESLRRSDV
jgi:hypothetical protein